MILNTRIGSKSLIVNDRSDWIIIPDSHPAIVSKEDFAKAQDMLKRPKELSPNKPEPSKVSRSCQSKIVSGERKSNAVPYGYTINEDGGWEVADTTASVVNEIFDMALQGLSTKAISDKLYEVSYPTPSEQVKLNKGYDIQPTNRWMPQAVRDILQDEQYIGTYIAGKTYQVAGNKKYHKPKSEWVRIPDRHPAIIDKNIFEWVQAIRAVSRKNMSRREYLLSGKTACGCCGFALSYNDYNINKTYRCMKTHADPSAECHKMKVSADGLESAVMTINQEASRGRFRFRGFIGVQETGAGARSIEDCERQINQLAEQRQQCYERFLCGEIERDAFQSMKADYSAQIDRLNNQLALLKQVERDKEADKKAVSAAKSALSEKATPRDVVNTLVDKVLVFPGNHVEIHWKFANFAAGL